MLKKKYNKKKTGFQARKIHVDRAKLINESPVIELEDGSEITYIFDNLESYNEFKRLGLYYKYEPIVSNSTLTYINDDINNKYIIKDNMTTEKEYFEPIIYDEVIKFMTNKNYTCSK